MSDRINILVRAVPLTDHRKLKVLAAQNNRSMEAELRDLIAKAVAAINLPSGEG